MGMQRNSDKQELSHWNGSGCEQNALKIQQRQELEDEQKDKLTSLPADTLASSSSSGGEPDKTKRKTMIVEQQQQQVANNGPVMDHHDDQQRQHYGGRYTELELELDGDDDLQVDLDIDDENGEISRTNRQDENRCLTPAAETTAAAAAAASEQQVAAAAAHSSQYSKQFNRLDPNRRSFSSPSVSTLSVVVAANSAKAKNCCQNGANSADTGSQATHATQAALGTQVFHSSGARYANQQQPPRTESVRVESKRRQANGKAGKQAGSAEKLRRRTALGLIGSFGSSHFRLSSSRVAPDVVAASSPNQNSPSNASAPEQVSGSSGGGGGWRSWFLGGARTNAAAAEPNSADVNNKPARTANTRKFLLRNLKPSQATPQLQPQVSANCGDTTPTTATASTRSQRQPAERPCGLKSTEIQPADQEQHPIVCEQQLRKRLHVDDAHNCGQLKEAATHLDHQQTREITTQPLVEPAPQIFDSNNKSRSKELESTDSADHQQRDADKSTGVAGSTGQIQRTESVTNIPVNNSKPSKQQYQEETACETLEEPRDPPPVTGAAPENQDNQQPQKGARPTGAGEEAMPPAVRQPHTSELAASLEAASSGAPIVSVDTQQQSLVDRLIDSQLEWRQIIRDANGSQAASLLNQLGELKIKRQEVIHELVQTERHHCLTLALMRQVYMNGLRQLNESRSLRDAQHNAAHIQLQLSNSMQHHTMSTKRSSSSSSSDPHHQKHSSHTHLTTTITQPPPPLPVDYSTACLPPPPLPQQQQQQQPSPTTTNQQQGNLLSTTSDLIDLERLFPALEDLIQAHELFFAHLRLRLVESCQVQQQAGSTQARLIGLVGPLGDLLCDQFRLHRPPADGDGGGHLAANKAAAAGQQSKPAAAANGHKLLQAYAKFCGQHYDSSRYYKHLMQNDKGFKQFIEHCNKQNASCRQRGIPECNLLVTQRLTKYPLLIEQLIKTSKDDPEEEQKLAEALKECKALLAELNNQLARKESFERLLDIYAQFSPKSYTIYNRHLKFTKHDLLQHKRLRQLLHSDGQIRIWSATRRKLFQVLCLILNDIVVFLRIESSTSSVATPPHPSSAAHHLYQHHLAAAAIEPSPDAAAEQQQSLAATQPWLLHGASANCGGSLMLASSPNLSSIPQAATGSGCPAGAGSGSNASNQSFSIKYYFANIDNKSSVISLSKLLVREKAATDQEPRVYLISSSPRQPEMYELAFVSKRHQTSFVDKLKACVEQHNKSLAVEGHRDPLLYDDDDDEDEEEDYFVANDNEEDETAEQQLHGLHDLSGQCLCDEPDTEHEHHLYDDEYDHHHHHHRRRNATMHEDDDSEAHDADEDDEEEVAFRSCTNDATGSYCRACHRPEAGSDRRSHSKRRVSGATELDEFELDIEQDVVPEPSGAQSGSEASFIYATADGSAECSSGFDRQSETGGGNRKSEGPRASSSEPEAMSNESGLSERAKDSLDEAAPSKQRLRANRRRRAQRPRNVSNQSSSSSEAGHCQAIQLISSHCSTNAVANGAGTEAATASTTKYEEEEFDSGRGHDDSSSAASTSSNSLGSRSVSASNSCVDATSQQQQQQVAAKEHAESIKSNSSDASKKGKKPLIKAATCSQSCSQQQHLNRTTGIGSNENGEKNQTATTSTSSCASSTASGSTLASATLNNTKAASGSNLIKCSSILGKSSCSFMKQRKLSTVSTMSSQLKLISKLKSNHYREQQNQGQLQPFAAGGAPTAGTGCCCCTSQQHSNTLNKQLRQQIRRSTFIPEQKLEELRDLRIQLDKDKQEWQAKFDKMQEQLLNERRELDLDREKLKQEKQQVANEREQFYRKLDVLKEKGILLSPSHKVIITTPDLRIYPPNGNNNNNNSENFKQQNYNQYNNNNNGILFQRQPLHQINQDSNHSSTIQIVNQSSPQRYYQHQQQQNPSSNRSVMHNSGGITYPASNISQLNDQQQHANEASNRVGGLDRRHSSNLFAQNGKVPLHLSEKSSSTQQQHKSSSMSLMSKVSLIGSTGSSLLAERLCGSSSASSSSKLSSAHIESHVI